MTGNQVAITQAAERAGGQLARMRASRDERAARGGPEAVAEAARTPGGPPVDAIAALYAGLREQAAGQPAA